MKCGGMCQICRVETRLGWKGRWRGVTELSSEVPVFGLMCWTRSVTWNQKSWKQHQNNSQGETLRTEPEVGSWMSALNTTVEIRTQESRTESRCDEQHDRSSRTEVMHAGRSGGIFLEVPGFLETLWPCDIRSCNYAFARLLHNSFKGDFDWLALVTLPSSNQCLPGRCVHGIGQAWFTRLALKGGMTNSRDKSERGGPSKRMSRLSK